jgi:tetratricopeptide (TPR) repeat protein
MTVRTMLLVAGSATLAAGACRRADPAPRPSARGPEVEVGELIQQGRADEALSRLESLPGGPRTWLLQGRAWSKKAETAPLPTPPPLSEGAPPGAEPPRAPEFKAEELKALDAFERAAAGDPQLAAAHLAIAELLAPHALRRHEAQAQQPKKGRKGLPPPTPAPAPGEPDWSVDRVLRAYQQAAHVEEGSRDAIEPWIRFALGTGRLQEADAAFRELIKRDRENADPLARYGDFLWHMRREPELAVERYEQALIWRPDDASIKGRLADIYLDLGSERLSRREYMSAQVHFDAARKYVPGPSSPQAQRLRDYELRLREVRQGGR